MELSSEDEVHIIGFTHNQPIPVSSPGPTLVVEDLQSRVLAVASPREPVPSVAARSLSPSSPECIHDGSNTSSESPGLLSSPSPQSPPTGLLPQSPPTGLLPPSPPTGLLQPSPPTVPSPRFRPFPHAIHHPPSPPTILPPPPFRDIPFHRRRPRYTRSRTPAPLPPSLNSILVHRERSLRTSTQPSNKKPNPKANPELKNLADNLRNLLQQLHLLSQRRIAERAATNAPEDGPKPETCPICFENFHCPGTCATRCGHVFHRKCLDTCLNNSRSCPVCRANVHRAELVDLMSGFGEKVERESAVIDLINGSDNEERGALDESLLEALNNVRELTARTQALENFAADTAKEKDALKADIALREKRLETSKANYRKLVDHREGEFKKRTNRITKTEEVIREKHEDLNTALCELRNKETALQISQGKVEAERTENIAMRHALEKEKESIREKERRMMALQEAQKQRKTKERDEGTRERIAMLERLLRANGIAIPTECDADRRLEPDKDAFKVDLSNEVSIVETPVKRRKVYEPAKLGSVFGGDLKKPSAYSRPQAPRRKGVSIKSFAPERKNVYRPAAVARRGLNFVSKR